ncbi:MAC/Perforin domain containing protein, partial [Plasmodium cynomolgi strain B]
MGLKCYAICASALMLHLSVRCVSKSEDLFNPGLYTSNVDTSEKEHLINYLGMTYDIIRGNPLGDPLYALDMGYRRYVLRNKLSTRSDREGEESEHPLTEDQRGNQDGLSYTAYKRTNVKCSSGKEIHIINELDDINKEYNSYNFEAQYDIHPFNASNYYKMLVGRINKGDSIILQKEICVKYLFSLSERRDDMLDPFFLNMLDELGKNYQNIGGDKYKCNLQSYRNNKYSEECLKTVTPWMTFFNLYGTHFISGVYYGGRVINNLFVENDYLTEGGRKIRLYTKRLNLFGGASRGGHHRGILFFGSVISSEKVRHIAERIVMVEGGSEAEVAPFAQTGENNPHGRKNGTTKISHKKWKNSIKGSSAKPVKLILIPFSDFIESADEKNAYYKALEFYSNLTYANYNPYPFQLNRSEKDLYKMHIKRWNQYIDKNINFNVMPKCKTGEKILSGFIITNKKRLYDDNNVMHVCPLSTECSSGINIESDKSFEFGWVLCSRENLQEIHQMKKLVQGNTTVITCPSKMKIGFGFSLTMQKGIQTNMKIEPCRSNVASCGLPPQVGENSQGFLWVNCLPSNKRLLLETLESKSFSEKMHLNDNALVRLECSRGKFIIAGFAVDYTASSIDDYLICPVGSSACELKIRVEQ